MSGYRFLMLGGGEGWHWDQLRSAASRCGCEIRLGSYQSLRACLSPGEPCRLACDAGPLDQFDAILTRTMPAGTLETITFRLATLHACLDHWPGTVIVNQPRALEVAIDKFATLARVSALGYPVPQTRVVQTRREALEVFGELGGDCVVKPIFGGEGRGVMRLRDRELAHYTFATLENLGAVFYVQQFVPPGGSDTRLLVIGDAVLGLRRHNPLDFRTNLSRGGSCGRFEPGADQKAMALQICRSIGLTFASVDLLDRDDDDSCVVEVNGIPGWKGAQQVTSVNIAQLIIEVLVKQV